jgi:hypothetical protein
MNTVPKPNRRLPAMMLRPPILRLFSLRGNREIPSGWETYPTWYPRGKDQDIGKEWKKGVTKLDEGMVENKTVD